MENEKPVHQPSEISDSAMPEQDSTDASVNQVGQLVQQCREELRVEQSSGSSQVQHRGFLIEKGIVEHSHDLELTGYCALKSEAGETVRQARDEFVKQSYLDPSYAQVKGILIEKGIRKDNEQDNEESTNEDMESASIGNFQAYAFIPSHIIEKTNYINEFTERLESRPDIEDWEKFRTCIREVHEFHSNKLSELDGVERILEKPLENTGAQMSKDLNQVEKDIDKMMQPLNELMLRSQKLTNSIESIENKISSLDMRVDSFHMRYNENLHKREKSFEDMMALQRMRERIGQRLANIEAEIHESKTLLLQGRLQKK